MTAPPDQDHLGEDSQARCPTLEAIDQDLERLGELTGPYVTDAREDLSAAAARIPDDDRRREAEELLRRLRPVIEPHLDAIEQASPGVDGLAPGLARPSRLVSTPRGSQACRGAQRACRGGRRSCRGAQRACRGVTSLPWRLTGVRELRSRVRPGRACRPVAAPRCRGRERTWRTRPGGTRSWPGRSP
jgi:hypothetical protein